MDFTRNLPWLATYMSEYAIFGKFPVFGQAWSLGIEEKFYLAWPSLAFLFLSSQKSRLTAAIGLSVILSVCSFAGVLQILFCKSYAALFVGCALALMLNDRRWFERLKLLGSRSAQTICFGAALLFQVLPIFAVTRNTPVYAFTAAFVIASAVIGARSIWTTVLSSRVLTYIGQRSYAIYLIHVLATHIVDRTHIFAAHTPAAAMGAFAAILALSLLVAEGLYRFVEGPAFDSVTPGRRRSRVRWRRRAAPRASP